MAELATIAEKSTINASGLIGRITHIAPEKPNCKVRPITFYCQKANDKSWIYTMAFGDGLTDTKYSKKIITELEKRQKIIRLDTPLDYFEGFSVSLWPNGGLYLSKSNLAGLEVPPDAAVEKRLILTLNREGVVVSSRGDYYLPEFA